MKDFLSLKRTSPHFPRLLKEIQDPPERIWIRGEWDLEAPTIAIVGTRKPTSYGRDSAQFFSDALSRAGFTVVSGLALGIDTIAHQAALEAGGKTVAVLGSGIDVITPSSNQILAERIENHGCLLSEFPPGTPAYPANFPQRNRIMSGLSLGVLVIEAGEGSGALITARFAGEQGREVFSVPGPLFSRQSAGTNRLIQEGAKLVMTPEDVVEEFSHLPLRLKEHTPPASLDFASETILTTLKERGALSFDEMVALTRMHSGALQAELTRLELQRLIQRGEDGTYRVLR